MKKFDEFFIRTYGMKEMKNRTMRELVRIGYTQSSLEYLLDFILTTHSGMTLYCTNVASTRKEVTLQDLVEMPTYMPPVPQMPPPMPTPKAKVKYYMWKICTRGSSWQPTDFYISDKGLNTIGRRYYIEWENLEKIRKDDDFIEL